MVSLLLYPALLLINLPNHAAVSWYWPTPLGAGQPVVSSLGLFAVLLAFICNATVFVRRRHPWVTWGAGAVMVLLGQFDPLLLFVGTHALIVHRGGRQATIGTIAAGVIGVWVVIRNAIAPLHWTVMLDPVGLPTGQRVLLDLTMTGLVFVVTVMLGRMRRNRQQARAADARAVRAEGTARDLSEQLTQRAERERLAREIHDTLAHRLSLVSLHSGALEELAQSSDPTLVQAAQVVRNSAHRSLEDLRNLIGALRDPAPAGPVEQPSRIPLRGMADVTDVIDSTLAAGVKVNAFIMLSSPEEASDMLNRAVFRIVQESLTNVVKHAPGTTVGLDLRGSPGAGVSLKIRNMMTHHSSGTPGSGTGLVGMRERVGLLGGRMNAGPTGDGWFEVDVQLPWAAAAKQGR
ncbi:hypothetical protein CGZ91_00935 [Parenemella sanctibonifatiensis]|uniref:histidine kinase n=1 Tax=Parenemella sanctibonifatiensis TaxID=2016505 RepID=A0A255EKU9_9ACTN|nr:hypothetical protein CGZ91_00935 [Parenemella sanctibonifatiensis]